MIAGLWSITGAAEPAYGDQIPPDADVLLALAESEDAVLGSVPHIATETSREPKVPLVRRRWWTSPKVLATAAVLAAVGVGILEILRLDTVAYAPLVQEQITTGEGERATVVLGDGTRIRLGAHSRLHLKREGVGVVAELDGRGFFGVTANPARPFIVRTKYGEAVVRGTRFEVRSEQEEFRVLVVDGEVSVLAAGVVTELTAGDVGLSKRGAPPTSFKIDDVGKQLEWMGNALFFEATPLWRAIAEIEGRYDVSIHLETPSLGELTVTATFTDQEWEEVVQVLCEVVRAKCSIEGGEVRIR
jgi:transmembrane sensor